MMILEEKGSGWSRRVGGLLLVVAFVGSGCTDLTSQDDRFTEDPDDVQFAPSLGIDLDDFEDHPAGLLYRLDAFGEGPEASPGAEIEVAMTGWLPSGEVFAEWDSVDPLSFVLGQPQFEVVAGVHEGVNGMVTGEIRTLVVPPYLGYGGAPPPDSGVPTHSWLVYRVELVTVDGQGGGPD